MFAQCQLTKTHKLDAFSPDTFAAGSPACGLLRAITSAVYVGEYCSGASAYWVGRPERKPLGQEDSVALPNILLIVSLSPLVRRFVLADGLEVGRRVKAA